MSSCSCGIYAFHPDVDVFQPRLVTGRQIRKGVWTAWGEVEAWGDVEVHPTGFRAEYARPVSVFVPSLLAPVVRDRIREVAKAHAIVPERERSLIGRRRKPCVEAGLSARFRDALFAGNPGVA